jgi:hypothetical protein
VPYFSTCASRCAGNRVKGPGKSFVAEAEAVDALQSSKNWAILHEMDAEGDNPEVVWKYADGIAGDGTVVGGRVLTVEEAYQKALGCD